LVLDLCLNGLQVHLSSLQASSLLLKVVRIAVGTLVQRHELRNLISENLIVDVVAHAWWGIVVDVV
jgi:hypothetical protein